MRYSLRSLMIVGLVAPPLLAGGYLFWRTLGEELNGFVWFVASFVILFGIFPYAIYRLTAPRP